VNKGKRGRGNGNPHSDFHRLQRLVSTPWCRALGVYLLEELYSFVGEGWEQEDDITLVTLRCSAPLS
jgi:hypothetical protein